VDTLTHALFGLAIGAVRRREPGPLAASDKAILLACVLAAEIPDLDYLLPAPNPVLVTLRAHRGLSHAIAAAPAVAAIAALVAKGIYRKAATPPIFGQALAAVLLGHLLPDLWTGWGTRVLLPWSSERFTLDWTAVIDPWVTLPLLAGAFFAYRARARDFRKALWLGLALACLYLGVRITLREVLQTSVEARYRTAAHVFPAPLRLFEWRYVVEVDDGYAAGVVGVGAEPVEQARHPRGTSGLLATDTLVAEVLAWARYPVIEVAPHPEGGTTVRVADLRYHAGGRPTLTFVMRLDEGGRVAEAHLDRGGSAAELLQRFRR
jgi:inner membrane protein